MLSSCLSLVVDVQYNHNIGTKNNTVQKQKRCKHDIDPHEDALLKLGMSGSKHQGCRERMDTWWDVLHTRHISAHDLGLAEIQKISRRNPKKFRKKLKKIHSDDQLYRGAEPADGVMFCTAANNRIYISA